MSKVVRENVDNTHATLTITIEKSDYEAKFKAELNKYQREAHMKGFRKGKVPTNVLRKMYGKSILAEVVGELLQKEIEDFLQSEDASRVIGQPLPADQQNLRFDAIDSQEYTFVFDLGMVPEFELQGLGPDTAIEHYKLAVTEDMVDEVLAKGLESYEHFVSVDGPIEETDRLRLRVRELGEDGQLKEGGVESEFDLLFEALATAELKDAFRALQKGATLTANPFELEEDLDESLVRKYLLNLEDSDDREVGTAFEATIIDVKRKAPSEIGPDFYRYMLGENAPATEAEAREAVKASIERDYERNTRALLYNSIQDKLLELNPIELPEAFIRRAMNAQDKPMTEEEIGEELPAALKSVRWGTIMQKLAKRFNVQIDEQDLLNRVVRTMFGSLGNVSMAGMEDVLMQAAARALNDNEELYREIYHAVLNEKTFEAAAGTLSLEPVYLSQEDLLEKMNALRPAGSADEEE